jgi:hypothetical protein
MKKIKIKYTVMITQNNIMTAILKSRISDNQEFNVQPATQNVSTVVVPSMPTKTPASAS